MLMMILISSGIFGQVFNRKTLEGDSILIHSDVKNQTKSFVIDSVMLSGNKHTKERIIFRELTFSPGDTLTGQNLVDKVRKSRQNLLNTTLFNFVTIEDTVVSKGNISHLILKIAFVEQWYLWPLPIFEISDRNFNTWWQNKDFSKINYGIYLTKKNFRGRMEILQLLLRFGYDERYALYYFIPYINKKQTLGAAIGTGWSQNHEIAFATFNNKQLFIRGEENHLFKNYYAYLNLSLRPNFYSYHNFRLSYNYYAFADTVLKLNPDYSFKNQNVNEYMELAYQFIGDHRDYKVYPLTGLYYSFRFTKSGLGILKDGNISMMDLLGSFRKYWKIVDRFHISADLTGKISTNYDQPYFYQQGLGHGRNFIRGYELYVIDGQSYFLSKNTFKFTLLPTKEKKIGFIRSDRFGKIHYAFYLNYFFDFGYVQDSKASEYNTLANKLLFGTGVGIDLVTIYDLVFRVEFSVNRQGETGIYIHFRNTI